jgi:RNA polymerase sigma factor (sigma-70 family)
LQLSRTEADDLPDGQLLERYVQGGDEQAFAALVRRHGPMVLGVCRRVLGHEQEAEDTFQAAFLVLVRTAGSVRKQTSFRSWLYGVAYRLALRARQDADRRRRREHHQPAASAGDHLAELTCRDLHAALEEELARLPESYRAPLLLCYLEGKTLDEAAGELGWANATLRRRRDRGLDLLRRRLTRRGVTFSLGLFSLALSQASARDALAPTLINQTVQAALSFGSGAPASTVVTPRAAALVNGGLRAMSQGKLKSVALFLFTLGLLGAGVGAYAWQGDREPNRPPAPPSHQEAAPPDAGKPAGPLAATPADVLPPGATARLGNLRWWAQNHFYAMQFAPDGKTAACAQMDGLIRIQQVPDGTEVRRLGSEWRPDPGRHLGFSPQLTFSRDGKLLGAVRGDKVVVYEVETGKRLHDFPVDLTVEVSCFGFSADGNVLLTGGRAEPARLWDLRTGKEKVKLQTQGPAPVVALAPDGRTAATAGEKQPAISLWDAATGQEIRRLKGHRNMAHALAFSPDGKTLASAGNDGTVRLWNPATGAEVQRHDCSQWTAATTAWSAQGGMTRFLTFTADGRVLLLGRTDYTIRGWLVETGKEQPRFLPPYTVFPGVAAVTPDGQTVGLVAPGGHIQFRDRTTGDQVVGQRAGHSMPVNMAVFSRDGRLLATASNDRTVRIWDVASGKEVRVIAGHTGPVDLVAFAPDGRQLVSCCCTDSADRLLSVWDLDDGLEVQQFHLPSEIIVRALAFSSDGKSLLAHVPGTPLRAFNVKTGQEENRYRTRLRLVNFSPDGTRFAGGALEPGKDHVWDTATEEPLVALEPRSLSNVGERSMRLNRGMPAPLPAPLPGPSFGDLYGAYLFSPDARFLLAPNPDSSLQLWDAVTGKRLRQLARVGDKREQARLSVSLFQGNPPRILAAWSPDNRSIALQEPYGSISLVEVSTGEVRGIFKGHKGPINWLAFSPDGQKLASASWDTTALLWDVTRPAVDGQPDLDRPLDDLEAAWRDLAEARAELAYVWMRALSSAPARTVAFLKERLQPVPKIEAGQLEKLIAALDSNEFAERKQAEKELLGLGERAQQALQTALQAKPPLDVTRRIEGMLEKIAAQMMPREQVRMLRALEVLERIRTPEAKQLLARLAGGAADSVITRDARDALRRLGHPAARP